MAIETESGLIVPFNRFWDWLLDHTGCVLTVHTVDAWLYDAEALHWAFFTEEGGAPVVQLILGKRPVGELVLDTSDTLHVQGVPDPDNLERGFYLFHVLGGLRSSPRIRYTFQLTHGMESVPKHVALKH